MSRQTGGRPGLALGGWAARGGRGRRQALRAPLPPQRPGAKATERRLPPGAPYGIPRSDLHVCWPALWGAHPQDTPAAGLDGAGFCFVPLYRNRYSLPINSPN